MTKPLFIRGVPRLLALDGWWLDAPPSGPDGRAEVRGRPVRGWGLLLLVALADWLFWRHDPGLSLALYAPAIFVLAGIDAGRRAALGRPALLLLAAAAPVVEHLQPLSAAFLALGLAGALVWMRRPEMTVLEAAGAATAFLTRLPRRWIALLSPRRGPVAEAVRGAGGRGGVRRLVRDWAVPLAGTLILAALMMRANPVLARAVSLDLDLWAMLSRLLFWSGAAILVAPLLARDLPGPVGPVRAVAVPAARLGLNPGSVLRALVLFNGVIGVQTATDLSILTFGAALPEGMTMAEYAHRGAYPLLAAALLAGAFALASRPFLREHRAIRPLLLLWLVQNMALCGAAMLRLDHYVDAFGLTHLRLYALIWMAVVAAGLGLVAAQALRDLPNVWLLTRCAALALATLYACSFVNFAQVIAARNLARPEIDTRHLCSLGPMAHGALRAALAERPDLIDGVPLCCAILSAPSVEGWRDWGFRSFRVSRYAAAAAEGERDE